MLRFLGVQWLPTRKVKRGDKKQPPRMLKTLDILASTGRDHTFALQVALMDCRTAHIGVDRGDPEIWLLIPDLVVAHCPASSEMGSWRGQGFGSQESRGRPAAQCVCPQGGQLSPGWEPLPRSPWGWVPQLQTSPFLRVRLPGVSFRSVSSLPG